MFLSEKVIYLELHKTGSTHIRHLLKDLLGGSFVGKHNQAARKLFDGKRVFLGSVRNPWHWYLSLWSYGCERKGAIFHATTQPMASFGGLGWDVSILDAMMRLRRNFTRDPKVWLDLYADIENVDAFKAWLKLIIDPDHLPDLGEGFSACLLSEFAGLMTYRYLKLYCSARGEMKGLSKLDNLEQLRDFERRNCFVSHFIRTEHLESDLFECLDKCGVSLSEEERSEILSRPRLNKTKRHISAIDYYDLESERLVYERDPIIIEKFGYLAPSVLSGV